MPTGTTFYIGRRMATKHRTSNGRHPITPSATLATLRMGAFRFDTIRSADGSNGWLRPDGQLSASIVI